MGQQSLVQLKSLREKPPVYMITEKNISNGYYANLITLSQGKISETRQIVTSQNGRQKNVEHGKSRTFQTISDISRNIFHQLEKFSLLKKYTFRKHKKGNLESKFLQFLIYNFLHITNLCTCSKIFEVRK